MIVTLASVESVGDPLSVTRKVTVVVPTCTAVGVQVKVPVTPLDDGPLTTGNVAPVGRPPVPGCSVSVCPASVSVAVTVKVSVCPAVSDFGGIAPIAGAAFGGAVTVTVTLALATPPRPSSML